jgi:hypothetical protein
LELEVEDLPHFNLGSPPRAQYPLVVMAVDMDALEKPLEEVLQIQQIVSPPAYRTHFPLVFFRSVW